MTDARVVVVGSGPCGAMAAWQLVQRGIPVVLLESGQRTPSGLLLRAFGRNLYRKKPDGYFGSDCGQHVATGDPNTKWYFCLEPGGLSNHWTGAVPRFSTEDFEEGARLHEKYRWPVSHDDLAPYYDRVERLMDVVGPGEAVPNLPAGYVADRRRLPLDWQQVADTAASRGQGLVSIPIADGRRHMLVRRGTAFNSFTNLVQPLERSPLLTLKCGAHAMFLEWSRAQQRVEAVVYRDAGGEEHRITAKAFVIAAGPLQSTRLLFDSANSDFPEGLGNSRGLLGKYLHDHPREWWVLETGKAMSRINPAVYLTRRPAQQSEPLLSTSWTIGAPSTKEKLLSLTPLKGNEFGVQVFGTMIPTEDTSVSVAEQKDAFGLSKLEIKIRFDEASLENLRRAQDDLLELMEAAGVPSTIQPVPPGQVAPGTAVHYGGTARMHASPEFGVLDSFNRVYDAPNVLVCDAACFTTGAEKNPTLTAMALAARACDHLADSLKREN